MNFTGERFIPEDNHESEIFIEHMLRYQSVMNLVKDKVVVDGSCGEGYGSFLMSQSAKKVIGIDISEQAINYCKSKYQNDNLEYVISDFTNSSFIEDNSIDVYISFETFEHVSSDAQLKFIKEVKRVLKEEGILIISTPDKEIYNIFRQTPNNFHVHEVTKSEFIEVLSQSFKTIKTYIQTFNIANMIYSNDTVNLKINNNIENNHLAPYIICICSDNSINIDIASMYIDNSNRYFNLMEYIVTKENEIEKLSQWGLNQDKEIKSLIGKIEALEKTSTTSELQLTINELETTNQNLISLNEDNKLVINTLNEKLINLEESLDKKTSIEKTLNDKINNYEKILNEKNELSDNYKYLKEELENKRVELHNFSNTLKEKENRLDKIYTSRGYRFLQFLYRIVNFILPIDSKRRLLVRLFVFGVSHPIKVLKYLRPKYLKNFIVNFFKKDPNVLFNDIHRDITKLNLKEEYQIQDLDISNYEILEFPKYFYPLVSIIIPVYNQWNYTYSCLKSIYENTKDVTYEIIIADDVSSDETINIKKYIKNIVVNRNKKNLGFLLNCNEAASLARGKYLHFLNNDTNVQENWLSSLVEVMEKQQNVGLVGSKLVYSNGQLQEAGGIIWNDATGWNYGRLFEPQKPDFNYLKSVDYISGASIMIPNSLWHQIGGFDKRYVPAYFEDTDLAFTVRKLGYKVIYQPKSVVIHFEGISHGTDIGGGIKKYQAINKEKFSSKWADVLKNHLPKGENVFLARDRSYNKKHILIIDHYVPHFDKDAGSKCTFHYLKLFLRMNLQITFIGDNFFPHAPYTEILQQMGINVLYGDWYFLNKDEWLKENGKYFDFIYLNRPHIAIKYIDLLRKYSSAKIIYFGHDLHYLRDLRNYEIEKDPKLLESSKTWKKTELELIHKSDIIFAPGSYEEAVIKDLVPEKIVKGIPIYIYEDVEKIDYDYDKRSNLMFVGGFGHKPNIDAIKWFSIEIFPLIKEKISEIKFYVIGSNPPEEIKKLNSDDIIITGFISDGELLDHYRRHRLVISPLRFGAGVKGKNIEAIYNQIPLITTTIGAEGLPEAEKVLLIGDNAKEIADLITRTYLDKERCLAISNQEYLYINKHFTQDVVYEEIIGYFNK